MGILRFIAKLGRPGPDTPVADGVDIDIDATGFSQNLDATDTNVQRLAGKVDGLQTGLLMVRMGDEVATYVYTTASGAPGAGEFKVGAGLLLLNETDATGAVRSDALNALLVGDRFGLRSDHGGESWSVRVVSNTSIDATHREIAFDTPAGTAPAFGSGERFTLVEFTTFNAMQLEEGDGIELTRTAGSTVVIGIRSDVARFRGAWTAGESYVVGDSVRRDDTLLSCKTANDDAVFDADKWDDLVGGGRGQELTDAQIGRKAAENVPVDLTNAQKVQASQRLGAEFEGEVDVSYAATTSAAVPDAWHNKVVNITLGENVRLTVNFSAGATIYAFPGFLCRVVKAASDGVVAIGGVTLEDAGAWADVVRLGDDWYVFPSSPPGVVRGVGTPSADTYGRLNILHEQLQLTESYQTASTPNQATFRRYGRLIYAGEYDTDPDPADTSEFSVGNWYFNRANHRPRILSDSGGRHWEDTRFKALGVVYQRDWLSDSDATPHVQAVGDVYYNRVTQELREVATFTAGSAPQTRYKFQRAATSEDLTRIQSLINTITETAAHDRENARIAQTALARMYKSKDEYLADPLDTSPFRIYQPDGTVGITAVDDLDGDYILVFKNPSALLSGAIAGAPERIDELRISITNGGISQRVHSVDPYTYSANQQVIGFNISDAEESSVVASITQPYVDFRVAYYLSNGAVGTAVNYRMPINPAIETQTDAVQRVVGNASTTRRGVVELATTAETRGGEDTEKAVVPLAVSSAIGHRRIIHSQSDLTLAFERAGDTYRLFGSTARTFTLPAMRGQSDVGTWFTIIDDSTASLTLRAAAGETIQGQQQVVIPSRQTVQVQAISHIPPAQWDIVSTTGGGGADHDQTARDAAAAAQDTADGNTRSIAAVLDDVQRAALHVSVLWPDGTSSPLSYMNAHTLTELFQRNPSQNTAIANMRSPIGFQIEGFIEGFSGLANLQGVFINGTVARGNTALTTEERISDGHFNLVAHPTNRALSNIEGSLGQGFIAFTVRYIIGGQPGIYEVRLPVDTRPPRDLPDTVPYIHPEYLLDDIYRRVSELQVMESAQIWADVDSGQVQIAAIDATTTLGMSILSGTFDPSTLTVQTAWGYTYTQPTSATAQVLILARIPIDAVDREDQLDDRYRVEIARQGHPTIYTTVGGPIATGNAFYYMHVTNAQASPSVAIAFKIQVLTNPYRIVYNDLLGPRAIASIPGGGGGGLDQAQVDARIATYARATPSGQMAAAQLPAEIPDGNIPASIARTSAVTTEATARASGDQIQGIEVGSASQYQSTLNAQRTSTMALLLHIRAAISGTRGGSAYSWNLGDVLYFSPGSDSAERVFNISTPIASADLAFRSGILGLSDARRSEFGTLAGADIWLRDEEAAPIAPTQANQDKILWRWWEKRAYFNRPTHYTAPTLAKRNLASSDLPVGYTWGGVITVGQSGG